jgi:hypothetical protein
MSQASGRRVYPNGGIAPFRVTDSGGESGVLSQRVHVLSENIVFGGVACTLPIYIAIGFLMLLLAVATIVFLSGGKS